MEFARYPGKALRNLSWHLVLAQDLYEILHTDPARGLTQREVEARLREHGPNLLKKAQGPSPFGIFIEQFRDFMVLVLLGAVAISAFLGEIGDAATILAIVVINAILGFIQEYRAERSLEALKELAAPQARVLRDGKMTTVPADTLVPGDILILEVGDRIPADARLIEAIAMEVEESILTGESVPRAKSHLDIKDARKAPAERTNMVFMGTNITRGRGKAVVVATGMDTELGKIADLVSKAKVEDTPLQRRLQGLGRRLVLICGALCALISVLGVLRGESVIDMFLEGVSLAVAAIPEGLPAVVTIALAIGVERMARRRAIIRKLPAVETLGCTTVICSDKTGTLTRNEMTVKEIRLGKRTITVTGLGYDPKGDFLEGGQKIDPRHDPHLRLLLETGVLCNNAQLRRFGATIIPMWRTRRGGSRPRGQKKQTWNIVGDPTEGALLVAGAKAGLWKEDIERGMRWINEIPFESERRMMTVIYETTGGRVAYVKGAVDVLLERSSHIYENGGARPITSRDIAAISSDVKSMARDALRVLGVAVRNLPSRIRPDDPAAVEGELTFLGLVGMADPPREEVGPAIARARGAGIRTIMITGDHEDTAIAIACELGLASRNDRALTGAALDSMTERDLSRAVEEVSVYARVSPKHKLRIVRALKDLGHVVAMTGDGVNDAPAIKQADIGISMGISGTDVTREASSVVLADDNYATIVAAIEEGRGIYDNIRKFIRYLLGCNAGEVLTMILAVGIGLPFPLLPIQILWMNLVTDGLPAIALGMDPREPDLMKRKPRDPQEGIFSRGLALKILMQGISIAFGTIALFIVKHFALGGTLTEARTLAFTGLVMSQLFYVFHSRSEHRSILEMNPLSNPYLVGAVLVSSVMQIIVIYLPVLQPVFKTAPLSLSDWVLVGIMATWSSALYLIARSFRRAVVRRFATVRV